MELVDKFKDGHLCLDYKAWEELSEPTQDNELANVSSRLLHDMITRLLYGDLDHTSMEFILNTLDDQGLIKEVNDD